MKKRLLCFIMCLVFVTGLTYPASAAGTGPKEVLVFDSFGVGRGMYATYAASVGEFLAQEGIWLDTADIVVPPPHTPIFEGLEIYIYRGHDATFEIIDGGYASYHTVKVPQGTLGAAITYYSDLTGLTYADNYTDRELESEIYEGSVISLRLLQEEYVSYYEEIPFVTEIIYSSEIDENESYVLVWGVPGVLFATETVFYDNGMEYAREIESLDIITAPITHVLVMGKHIEPAITSGPFMPEENAEPVIDGLHFEYSEMIVMSATAYTLDYASTGKRPGDKYWGITASGLKAQVGVVAVDPNVIPLHTKLYIEGYGYAIAGDTGKSVKGNIIDLFFDSAAEVRAFGRRTRRVYILSDQNFEIAIIR